MKSQSGRGPSLEVKAKPQTITPGGKVQLSAELFLPPSRSLERLEVTWSMPGDVTKSRIRPAAVTPALTELAMAEVDTTGLPEASYEVVVTAEGLLDDGDRFSVEQTAEFEVRGKPSEVSVRLNRSLATPSRELPLWVIIRRSTEALSFDNYTRFMDQVFCDPNSHRFGRKQVGSLRRRRFLPFNDSDAYRFLKVATEAFLLVNCGVDRGSWNEEDTGPLPEWGRDSVDQTFSPFETAEVAERVGFDATGRDLNEFWEKYLREVNGDADPLIPYFALIKNKLSDIRFDEDPSVPESCYTVVRNKLTFPCFLELIWSYWHEEGMLVQTINAITRRFQNLRGPGDRDPLANLEIDPLRSLNNLLWGYLQDEQHRLSLERRVYEYSHHYGLTLHGKAVPILRPADSRLRFLEAFHNLLYLCAIFFREDDDTTVIADGFPVLNALKEVHLLLSEGAHNQFGDLPSTARIEMLMQQWLLGRPEFREFLPTRIMVAYPERWMDRVDAMKSIQGWTDVSTLHFHNLAVFGEQILLSVRYTAWSRVNEASFAVNWLRFWRSQVQGYIHAYRAVTGVDLTAEVTDARQASARNLPPAVHLRNRLMEQRSRISAGAGVASGDDARLGPGEYDQQPARLPAAAPVRRRLPPASRKPQ